ncbi:MAG: NAD(P)H-dependent oxidoreductase subunit E [Lentisphaeria bacterium]|nr:NAD(P)H-dependent oxidoreductase subunit E [Lentisphaeria bacterium]
MKNLKIYVCMGSSCYSKGSNNIVKAVRTCIECEARNDIEIELVGCLCQGECMKGPMVKINDKIHTNVTPLSITKTLKEELNAVK